MKKKPQPKTPPTLAEVRKWPATVSVAQAARALGISSSHLHALMRREESPVAFIPFGATRRVITADLIAVLSGAPREVAA